MKQPISILTRRNFAVGTAALSALGLLAPAPSAYAQGKYPTRSPRLVLPFAAGGVADVTARIVAEKLGDVLGQFSGHVCETEAITNLRSTPRAFGNTGFGGRCIWMMFRQIVLKCGLNVSPSGVSRTGGPRLNKEETEMHAMKTWSVGCMIAMLAGAVLSAAAQAPWPSKPITYVVPFAPGGNTDTLARLIGPKLSSALGQPVVIDNKPGAGGNIGSAFAAKAAPNGYTILGGTISSHAINPSVYPNMPYDAVKSFEPVIMLGTGPLVLVAGAATPYKSLQDVIAAAKAKPGDLSFASAGPGTSPHLAGELFKILTQTDIIHVPYKGSGPAVTDVMAGHVPLMFDTMLVVGSHVRAGKMRALAVTSTKHLDSLPGVPTAAEAGVSGFEVGTWQAVFAPAGTPKPIVERLNKEIGQILKMPEIVAKLADLGLEPVGGSPEELGQFQKAEIEKWAKVVKEANVKPE